MDDNSKRAFALLDEARAAQRSDVGPRFAKATIKLDGETLRIRRLQIEQRIAARQRLEAVTYDPKKGISETQLPVVLHLVQIALVPADSSSLRFPGKVGQDQLASRLTAEHLAAIAAAIYEFNDLSPRTLVSAPAEPAAGKK